MSEGYLPPVVVQVTGDVRDLLAKLEEAKSALVDFSKTVSTAQLSADYSLVTKAIAAAEAEMKAFASQDAQARLGVTTSTIAPKIAEINAELAAWGREDASARAGLTTSAVAPDIAKINAELAQWGRRDANATAGLNYSTVPAGLAVINAALAKWGKTHAEATAGLNQGTFDAGLADAAAKLSAWASKPADKHIVFTSSAIPEPDWMLHPRIVWGNIPEPSWLAHPHVTETITAGTEPSWWSERGTVDLDANTIQLKAALASAQAQLTALTAKVRTVKIGGEVQKSLATSIAAAQLAIDKTHADIQVGADTSGALEKVAALKIAIDALSTSLVGDTGGGGGGKGGLAGALAAAGWGGGLFGLASIGSLAGLSGFGGERIITTLAGIAGFSAAGGLGGGLLGLASLGTAATGMATDLAGIGQAAGDIKNMYTATTNLQAAIAQYGKNSSQAAAAQYAYNQQLASFSPAARQAVIGAVAAIQGFITAFDAATGPAENIGAQIITQAIHAMEPLLPEIGSAALANMLKIQKALQPFFAWLDSVKPGGGIAVLTQIENVFTKNLPNAMTALTRGAEALAQVVAYLGPQTGKLTAWFAAFFTSITTPTPPPKPKWKPGESMPQYEQILAAWQASIPQYGLSNAAKSHIDKWVADWHVLTAFFKALVDAAEAIASASAGTGKSIFTTLTSMLDQFTAWARSKTGHAELNTLMQAHKLQLDAILRLLGSLIGAFGKLELGISPTIVNAITAVVKAFTGLLHLGDVGKTVASLVNSIASFLGVKVPSGADKAIESILDSITAFVGLKGLKVGEVAATAGAVLLLSTRIGILHRSLSAITGILTGKVTTPSQFWNVLTGKGSGLTGSAVKLNEAALALKEAAASLKGEGRLPGGGARGAAASDAEKTAETDVERGAFGTWLTAQLSKTTIGRVVLNAAESNITKFVVSKGLEITAPAMYVYGLGKLAIDVGGGISPALSGRATKAGDQQLISDINRIAEGLWTGIPADKTDWNQLIKAQQKMVTQAAAAFQAFTTGGETPAEYKALLAAFTKVEQSLKPGTPAYTEAAQALAYIEKTQAPAFVAALKKAESDLLAKKAGKTGLTPTEFAWAMNELGLKGHLYSTSNAQIIAAYQRELASTRATPTGAVNGGNIAMNTTIHIVSTGTPDMHRGSTFSNDLKKALDEHDRKLIQAIRSGRS